MIFLAVSGVRSSRACCQTPGTMTPSNSTITLHAEMHREIDDSLQTRSAFPWVAVGTRVSPRPPRRSVRAR